MSDDQRTIYLTIDLALRVGELVLSSGAGAADTTASMLSVTSAAGLRNCEVDVTFTSLTISYQGEPDAPPETHMRQVRYRALDYSHLTAIDHLVRAFAAGELGVEDARKELATIISAGHPYPKWAATLAWGGFAGLVGILIGGGPLVFLVAFGAGVLIDALSREMTKRRIPSFYQQVVGGFLATVIALTVGALVPGVRSSLVVAAVIILLLAGMAIVGAVQDALTGFYVTGSARGFEAVLLTGGIIGGIAGGLGLLSTLGLELSVQPFAPLGLGYLPIAALSSGAASAAFAFACFAPPRALLPVGLIGAMSQVAFRPAIELGLGAAWGSAMAALFVGMVSYSVAGRVRVPPLVVVVSGIVPLLPGLSTYRGLFQLFQGNVLGVTSLFAAVGIAVGIAAGVILGEYIAQPLRREARRLETRLAGPRLVGPMRPKRRPKKARPTREKAI